ncbi:tetratricopeptide repeat protein [Prochlorococcus marinus]|uniref:tetratricopeptide repeat protein n=1 Tax=Prochlorococcus marinus TaxID=1219 RepID=UPI0022B3B411|nr:tetratricopeptide repeat protein [Prochlorococcus marinus]
MGSSDKEQEKRKFTEVKTFTVPFRLGKIKENISISNNTTSKPAKEAIMSKAFKFHSQGNIPEAAKYYLYFINQGFKDHRVFTNYGIILNDLGKLKEAELLYRKAIEIQPNFADVHLNLGNILKDLGNLQEAEISQRKALEINPDFAEAHSNLGNILKDLGKLQEAEISTRKALEINPDFAEAHSNLGNILKDLGNLQEAEISTRKALEINPDFAKAHYNLGNILKDLGNLQEAEISQRKAIEIKPDFAEAHSNLGNILKDLGNLQEAELSTRKALELNPNFADAHSNLGNILMDLGKLQEAEISTRKAIEINPDFAKAHYNLGNILMDLGKLQEAEISQRKAIEINPNFAEAHSNMGIILKDLGKLKESKIATLKAIEINPNFAEAFLNLSLLELLQGDYKNGLENYEFRFKRKNPAIAHGITKLKRIEHKKSQKGEKLLVITEQGLGDTLQFMRYIPYIRNQGLKISFCAQTKLHSLIKSSGIDQHPLTPEEASEVSEGQWIPLLSLPRYLQVSPNNPIISNPYIFSTNELKKKWKNILSQEKRPIVAINWQGNPNAEKTDHIGRSLPLETFSSLTRNNNFKFLSLQKGFGSEQFHHCSFKNKFVECQAKIDATWDFLENAAIMENCDLIITSDTSIAHLAGGMGKPTWLLLNHLPDWRWGLKGDNTFWYPSMRLFRQNERHNWQEVMENVSNKLKKEIEVKT